MSAPRCSPIPSRFTSACTDDLASGLLLPDPLEALSAIALPIAPGAVEDSELASLLPEVHNVSTCTHRY